MLNMIIILDPKVDMHYNNNKFQTCKSIKVELLRNFPGTYLYLAEGVNK